MVPLDHSLVLAASGPDASVVAAFAVGFVSFISPCVLPLVPGYLSTISGVSFAELAAGRRRLAVLGPALVFCLSFSAMFVALGLTATGLGRLLQDHRALLAKVAGVAIVALGLLFVASALWPAVGREWRPRRLVEGARTGGPVVAGLAFAVAWLPCTGPTLGAILTAASTEATVSRGALLLAAYAAGLAVPFLLCAIAFARVAPLFSFLRNRWRVVATLAGVVLVAMGVLLYTDELARLNAEALALLDRLGLNVFARL